MRDADDQPTTETIDAGDGFDVIDGDEETPLNAPGGAFDPSGPGDEADALEPAGTSTQASATRIEQIIVDAQQSARQFVEEARQQSSVLLAEADREAQQRRGELIDAARTQIEDVSASANEMLEVMNGITAQLEEVVGTLRRSGDRIRENLDELLGPEEEADEEPADADAEPAAGGLRRFGRR